MAHDDAPEGVDVQDNASGEKEKRAACLGRDATTVWRAFRDLDSPNRLLEGRWVYPRAMIAGSAVEYLFVPCEPTHGLRLAISVSPIHTRWATDREDEALFDAIRRGRAEIYLRANRLDERWFEMQTPRMVLHEADGVLLPALPEEAASGAQQAGTGRALGEGIHNTQEARA